MFYIKTKDGRKYHGKDSYKVYSSRKDTEDGMYVTEFLIYLEPSEEFHLPNGLWYWVDSKNFIPD